MAVTALGRHSQQSVTCLLSPPMQLLLLRALVVITCTGAGWQSPQLIGLTPTLNRVPLPSITAIVVNITSAFIATKHTETTKFQHCFLLFIPSRAPPLPTPPPPPLKVSAVTGDLRVVAGKSDAFDENSQKVQTGALRFTFDPPLWTPPPIPPTPPLPPPPTGPLCPKGTTAMNAYDKSNASSVSTIGDQHHVLSSVKGWKGTPSEAAEVCCNATGCVAFSMEDSWGLELFTVTSVNVGGVIPGGTQLPIFACCIIVVFVC
jgi:hypothetical protein